MEAHAASPRRRATLKKKSGPKMKSIESQKAASAQTKKLEIEEKRKEKREKRQSRRLMGLLPPAHSKHEEHAEIETEAQLENHQEIQPLHNQELAQPEQEQLFESSPSPSSKGKHPHTLRERIHSLSETWDKARPYIERLNGTIVPLHHQGVDKEREESWVEEQRRRRSSGGRSSGGRSVTGAEREVDERGQTR